MRGRYKTWTLDSELDYGLDYGLNFGLDWTVASVLALLFKADYECNEWTNGLTVGTGIYAAFGKDWVVTIILLLQSPSPAGSL